MVQNSDDDGITSGGFNYPPKHPPRSSLFYPVLGFVAGYHRSRDKLRSQCRVIWLGFARFLLAQPLGYEHPCSCVNGRPLLGCNRMTYNSMYVQIHNLEQEAYCAVLRAFKAQSDALTWDKESLITELRKELRVSDDEHRELLSRANSDDVIHIIREWRQGGPQPATLGSSYPMHEVLPSPTFSASRKRQKTSVQSLPMQYSSPVPTISRQFSGRSLSIPPANAPGEAESLIGRRVWTRWPDDNSFYEAVITDYNPAEERHALAYDIHTANETWEWVNFKEANLARDRKKNHPMCRTISGSCRIRGSYCALCPCFPSHKSDDIWLQISPVDIQWEEDPPITHQGSMVGPGHRCKRRSGPSPGPGRGRIMARSQTKTDYLPMQNGVERKLPDDIELFDTELLVKEVERVFDVNLPDPDAVSKAKRLLKEHEQALVDAIARLGEASDGESDGGQPRHLLGRRQLIGH